MKLSRNTKIRLLSGVLSLAVALLFSFSRIKLPPILAAGMVLLYLVPLGALLELLCPLARREMMKMDAELAEENEQAIQKLIRNLEAKKPPSRSETILFYIFLLFLLGLCAGLILFLIYFIKNNELDAWGYALVVMLSLFILLFGTFFLLLSLASVFQWLKKAIKRKR